MGLATGASGCAAWPHTLHPPANLPPPRTAPDPFRSGDPLPVLPGPAAWAWPRVELGKAVATPPPILVGRPPGGVPTTTIAVGDDIRPQGLPWRTEYESTQRRPILTALLGSGSEHVLVTGSLSGNDPASVELLDALLEHLTAQPTLLDGRQAVLVRDPHPDGLAEHITVNARGVDLNRNFPSPRFTASPTRETGPHPASEAETRVLLRLLGDAKPGRVIHVRSGQSDRLLITGNAACLELLAQLRNDFGVDIATFDGEFKAGSLEEFAATRLKAQVLVMEFPAAAAAQPASVKVLVAAAVGGRKGTPASEATEKNAPVAVQPSTNPAALTGSVEQAGPDGEKGYVELLPPPPDFATDDASLTESRLYELTPP